MSGYRSGDRFEPLTPGTIVTNTPRAGDTAEEILARYARTVSTRTFDTGATRDSDTGKLDYEGFLSPRVLERYAQYMHAKRQMPDGSLRDSDNWQKGIPTDEYMKSLWRHFMDVWKNSRGVEAQDSLEDALCAVLFNTMGYLHEVLKAKG